MKTRIVLVLVALMLATAPVVAASGGEGKYGDQCRIAEQILDHVPAMQVAAMADQIVQHNPYVVSQLSTYRLGMTLSQGVITMFCPNLAGEIYQFCAEVNGTRYDYLCKAMY